MNSLQELNPREDPLGLRDLPPLDPPEGDWPAIQQALGRRRLAQRAGWLAAAASVLLVMGVLNRMPAPEMTTTDDSANPVAATLAEPDASDNQTQTVEDLIAMSQTLEGQVRRLREESGSMPAASAVFVAELEDLVAQVDNEISISPASVNLWGQRVNLLLDLAQLYQHQWEREYGRMASL
jgi:hypothetical protein